MAVIDAVGDVQRVTIGVQCQDTQAQLNNLCYICTVSGGTDTRNSLGLYVYNKYVTWYLPQMPPSATLYGYKVSSMNKNPAVMPVSLVVAGNVGGGANPTAPTQARPILRWSTASAGRKYRGRIFLPTPQGAGVQVSGYPTAAMTAAAQALGTALLATYTVAGSTWALVIAHRVKGLPTSTTTTPVLGALAPGLFGTQRRSGNTGRLNITPF